MPMKTSAVIADGTFETNTAPLLGPIDTVFRQAAELGYDAVSVTVNHPKDVDVDALKAAIEKYGVAVSGLATGRIYTVDGFTLGSGDEDNRMEAVNRMLGHAEICAQLGYDAVSVTVNHPKDVDVDALKAAIEKYGVAVSGLATGRIYTVDGFTLGSGDEDNRMEAVNRMLGHAEICAQLGGAKLIIGAIRGWTKDAGGRENYEKQFRKSMETLVKRAEELGIKIVMEAISYIDSDAYCLIGETAEYIRSFHSPALQLQLDSIHIYNNGETNFYEEILKAGDLVGQVDISDVDRMAPDGKHFDFPLFMKALHEVGYEDYLLSEYRAAPPENAAKVGLEYIKTLM